MSAPDRYGPGRFRGTHHHDAHDGGGVTRADGPWTRDADAGPTGADPFPRGSHWLDRDGDDDLIYADADPALAEPVAPVTRPEPATRTAIARADRHDGWTPERQRAFLAAVAEGFTVEEACRIAGMSPASAYALRRRAGGAAFALGWRAANLLAREHIADTLLARALGGQTETITRANGDVIERHRYDNRLAATLLARLDRQAEAEPGAPGSATHHAARMVSGEFDAYLDLVGREGGPARAGLFVALRAVGEGGGEPQRPEAGALADLAALARADRFVRAGAGTPAEVDVADLDPAARAGWTAPQWARAEAAGLLTLAPAPAPEPEETAPTPQLPPLHVEEDEGGFDPGLVWWEEDGEEYRTCLAPPAGFDGLEEGVFGDPIYARSLTPEEEVVAGPLIERERDAELADARAGRDWWFATARARLGGDGGGEEDRENRAEEDAGDGGARDQAPDGRAASPAAAGAGSDDAPAQRPSSPPTAPGRDADTGDAVASERPAAPADAGGTVAARRSFTPPTWHPAADEGLPA